MCHRGRKRHKTDSVHGGHQDHALSGGHRRRGQPKVQHVSQLEGKVGVRRQRGPVHQPVQIPRSRCLLDVPFVLGCKYSSEKIQSKNWRTSKNIPIFVLL